MCRGCCAAGLMRPEKSSYQSVERVAGVAMYSPAEIYENPSLLRFLSEEEQTPELCRTAVVSSCYAIRYVRNQTDDLVRMAVFCDPYCLLYVQRPNNTIMWTVLQDDPYNLRFIRSPAPDMIRSCIQRGGPGVLRYLQKVTDQIREVVRNYNPRFEEFISTNPVIPIYSRKRIVIRGGGAAY